MEKQLHPAKFFLQYNYSSYDCVIFLSFFNLSISLKVFKNVFTLVQINAPGGDVRIGLKKELSDGKRFRIMLRSQRENNFIFVR